MFRPNPPIPFPSPSVGSPGELVADIIRAQMAMAGGLWRWNSESVAFLTERARKDAELVSQLATLGPVSDAAMLVFGHMQSAWAGYAAQAMKLRTMLAQAPATDRDAAAGGASSPPQPEAPLKAAQRRVPAVPAKSARSPPV